MDKPADNKQPVVEVVDLVKRFEGRAVLDGINLAVYPGETMVVMGPSGCGKSTLLRHLIGTFGCDEGDVRLFGKSIGEMPEEELDSVRKRFGILFQSGALFNSMTVGENVALPLREHTDLDENTINIMVRIKLELVGLGNAVNLMPAEISGGMKKRAGLARAIALDPEILFYDEPTAGLDPVTTAEIDHLTRSLAEKQGVTSVVVTHVMESAFRVADRMAMLDQGKMLMVGSRDDFATIRDSAATGDPTKDLIRQFLRGDSDGPITRRRIVTNYEGDLLAAAKGRRR